MNLSSWFILIVLVMLVLYIIKDMRKQHKSGTNACAGNCAHCRMGCHTRH